MSEWTRERVDLIKRTVCPSGITDDEFALFIEQCKRSGLDPLLREAFCVPRRQNIGTRDHPRWIDKREFQPSEAGMLSRAEDFPDHRGASAAAVYDADACEVDAAAGQVLHKFHPGKKRGALLGAWARVEREGRTATVVWLDVDGYRQSSPMWSKIPATMIEKCARVAALRKAYPKVFGGLYIKEELPEGEEAQSVAALPATAGIRETIPERVVSPEPVANGKSKTEALKEQLRQATPPAPPAPIERIAEIAKSRGLMPVSIANAIREATGKMDRAQLTDEDVPKFSAYLDKMMGEDVPPSEEPPPGMALGEEANP
jgi:phage recombination protein Bet